MARKGAYVSILQFGEGYISLLRARESSSGLDVSDSVMKHGDWSADDASLGKALKAFASEHRLGADRIFTVLPRHEATLRTMDFPSQLNSELTGMVHFAAEEIVPYPIDEVVTGYTVLDSLEDGSSRLLVAVVHQPTITAHMDLLHAAGLRPEHIFLSTSCLLAALSGSSDSAHGVVQVSPGGVEFLVARGGAYAFGRAAPSHESWIGDGAHGVMLEEISGEIRDSLGVYRREGLDSPGLDSLSVCAEWGDVDGLAAELSSSSGVRCTAARGLLDVVDRGRDTLTGVPVVSVGAALLALGRESCGITLLPKTEVSRRAAAVSRNRSVRLVAVAVAVLLSLGGVFAQAYYQRVGYIQELERRVDELRPTVKSIRVKRQHLELLQDRVAQTESVLDFLGTVASVAPSEGLNVTRFSFDRNKGITLRGRTRKVEFSDKFIDDLRATSSMPQFARAKEMYRTLKKERGQDVWDFAITIPFSLVDSDE